MEADERLGGLEVVGVGPTEQRVYQSVIDHPAESRAEIGRRTGVGSSQLRGILSFLESIGLISRTPTAPPHYLPAPPEVAVEALVLHREEELAAARLVAAHLKDRSLKAIDRASTAELVEVVNGRQAFVQRYLQLQRTASIELVSLDKPPYVTPVAACNEAEFARLRRGVKERIIYDRQALEVPGRFQAILAAAAAGEEARTLAELPLKLAIADRRLGLIPLSVEREGGERAVLIHASPLLDALFVLFETLWARAAPIGFGNQDRHEAGAAFAGLSREEEGILALLAAGFKDEATARQLGVGVRTVKRRIRGIMDRLGAQTRFQAGMRVAETLRGGSGPPERDRISLRRDIYEASRPTPSATTPAPSETAPA